ncbi:MAG: sigma-70 family RNA polymerase sigma factor [Candidatus Koribacter versatilis]|uniref:Sigma-70 family RNA polymerase sigma factor n=1 Tax=Candidatus Korobacter versatilis TaxID=658062 RepID=A0A932AA22_9BACT|nr:sigma-70 family RNA polymerase sigma factor [Candidatus Koribacter versatilis]
MAGAGRVGELVSALAARSEEASVVEELKAGSDDAYAWLIAHYHQPIYSVVHRILADPADAADTTQEVFLKVFRGIKRFDGRSSLKTWMYRIAIHEASNQRRWWFRHKSREDSLEAEEFADANGNSHQSQRMEEALTDPACTPFENMAHEEVRARVEAEIRQVPEPYRTVVVLRDIEQLSYEEIAEVLDTSLGTVKSRLMRGRAALKKRLVKYVREAGPSLGVVSAEVVGPEDAPQERERKKLKRPAGEVEVLP